MLRHDSLEFRKALESNDQHRAAHALRPSVTHGGQRRTCSAAHVLEYTQSKEEDVGSP
jgi:hypothetical protein